MDKKARRCPHCDKVYVSMPAFSMHVRTHNQGCECPHCGKRFSRPWLLQGHIRTHTGTAYHAYTTIKNISNLIHLCRTPFTRRETIRMLHLHEGLRGQIESARSHSNPFEHEAAHVHQMRQIVCVEIVFVQARGVLLRAQPEQVDAFVVHVVTFVVLIVIVFCRIVSVE